MSTKIDFRKINIFHTDRGREFDNHLISEVLTRNDIKHSLSKKGCPYDNAVSEAIFIAIGGWLGFYFGGLDGLILALVIFVVADYITRVMCAIADRCLSSSVGFKGIFKKVVIFMLVGLAQALDSIFIGSGNMVRTAVIFFYVSNEGISLLENAIRLGLPIPEKLRNTLEQLKEEKEDSNNK